MKYFDTLLDLIIIAGFGFAQTGVLKGNARKYIDVGLDAIDTARKAFRLADEIGGDELTDEEKADSQRDFEAARARFRARLPQ